MENMHISHENHIFWINIGVSGKTMDPVIFIKDLRFDWCLSVDEYQQLSPTPDFFPVKPENPVKKTYYP